MLRPLCLVLVVTMVACTTSTPPGYCPPATTTFNKYVQQSVEQKLGVCWAEPMPPPQQQAVVGDGGACTADSSDPCSACVLMCAPAGEACAGAAPDAATLACVGENCAKACDP